MENYIIRIYRRDNDDPRKMNGIIESVEAGEQKPFGTYTELWEVLRSKDRDAEKSNKRKKRGA
ncbi:MAG: hypothetical protein OEW15_13970 [Nitrospirota bacterium]|nr:hypothetical protein [Nitrospirota bacterium]